MAETLSPHPAPELQQSSDHVIHLYEFLSSPPDTPTPYKAPEQWTRENFSGAVTDSFAKSQGSIMAQFAVLEWQRLNHGFAYAPTFENFLEAGGHTRLSQAEQDSMITAFNRVNQHGFRAVDTTSQNLLDLAVRTTHSVIGYPRHNNTTTHPKNERIARTREEVLQVVDATLGQLRRAYRKSDQGNIPIVGSWEELEGMPWHDFIRQLHPKLVPEKKESIKAQMEQSSP
jgi:hypothetical protein